MHDDESWVLTLLALAGWIQARRRAPGPEAVTTIGKGSPAHDRLFQALDLALPRRSYAAVIFALLTWLRVLIDGDDVEGAVFFHALCSCIPMYGGSPWYMDVVGRDASAMAARLPPSRMADIRARAEAADLWVEAGRLLERLREIVTG